MPFRAIAYTETLEAVGVPAGQARAHAKAIEDLVVADLATRDDLNRLEVKLDARFAQLEAKHESRFVQLEAKHESRFAQLDAKLDSRFAQIETRFAQQDAKFAELRQVMAEHEAKLTRWFMVGWASTIGMIVLVLARTAK